FPLYTNGSNTMVTLTAMPDAGSKFSKWTGTCVSLGTVPITGNTITFPVLFDANASVITSFPEDCTATFDQATETAVRLHPFGHENIANGPFQIEVVGSESGQLAAKAAPENISVTLLRQVFSPCRGLLFSSNRVQGI